MSSLYTNLMERFMTYFLSNWQLFIIITGLLFLLGGIFNWKWTWDPDGHGEKIMEMKVSPVVPADCQQFIHILRDDQSDFCFPLGTSLAGGADAWCVTYKFDKQTILPGSRLPEDGIVPFLLEAKPKKQIPIQLAAIPGKYYQA